MNEYPVPDLTPPNDELHHRLMATDPEYRAAYEQTFVGRAEALRKELRIFKRTMIDAMPKWLARYFK